MFLSVVLRLIAASLFIGLPAQGLHAESPIESATLDPAKASLVAAGQRIYREGLLPSGAPLKAHLAGDTTTSGSQAACINCHRRSGLGGFEGKVPVPPIVGQTLLTRLATPGFPAGSYTDATFKLAINEGKHPTGRDLHALMPRYALQDSESAALLAYLEYLGAQTTPGIDSHTLHLATIVSDHIPESRRQAMTGILQRNFAHSAPFKYATRTEAAFAARKQRVPNFAPQRQVQFDVWELKGPRESWGAQLETYYRQQPVFGIVSGLVDGSWQPVHDFCERNQIPCLFPNTTEPVVEERTFYNVYFNEGLYLEGEAAGKHIADHAGRRARVTQIYRKGDSAAELAAAGLREELGELGLKALQTVELKPTDEPGPEFWKQLQKSRKADVLAVWLKPADLKGIQVLNSVSSKPRKLYFSSALMGADGSALPPEIRPLTRMTHRQLVPGTPAFAKFRGSMQSSGIDVTQHEAELWLMGDTLWTAGLVTEALRQLKYPSREYLLENLEMLVNRAPPLLYSRLSLGPGQRYASKGCFVVNPNALTESEWIVP